jgi:menaquinone-dependent protoporphyrinogen oxidase
MDKKILVAYVSRTGSTAEVAGKVGEILRNREFDVDVAEVGDVGSLDEYQSVIIGSAIQNRQSLPKAT